MRWTDAEIEIISNAKTRAIAYHKIRYAGFKRSFAAVCRKYKLCYRLNKEAKDSMKLIELHWNNNTGEASVKFSPAFETAHVIVQLDMLQDCIADLTDRYNETLTHDGKQDDN